MSRKCIICSKGTVVGNTIARRGKAKREGGVGIKTTATTKREFRPNLQKRKILVDGKIKQVLVCAKCLKAGKISTAVKQPKKA
jgi:large subunit ribosomal protein L28